MLDYKFLKRCKKVFKDKDLILYKGKYPFNPITNKGRGSLTTEQLLVCTLLYKNNIPFIIEKKIISPEYNHFYIDIFVKGKYHFFGIEIDGLHHDKIKSQKRRDLKKEKFILKFHNIITIRIKNCIVNDFINDKIDELDEKFKQLNKKHFNCLNKHIFIAEQIGNIKRKLSEL